MTNAYPQNKSIVRPAALSGNGKLRLVSPASWFDPKKAETGMAALRKMGYQPSLSQNALARYAEYFAGTASERLDDLHDAFIDPDVAGIICNRGGYGSAELLQGIDIGRIRENPKIFVGCSDITTLLTWLHDATGLVTFHGPMAAGDFARPSGVDANGWHHALSQTEPWELNRNDGLRILRHGKATGRFYGGCLSMLVASLGTPYEIQTEDTILFLEDVGTKPYQIDRMLLQLRLAGKLKGVRGVVFGPMLDCVQPGQPADMLDKVVLRVLDDFSGPIAIGLRSGHVKERNITLPIGIRSELDLTSAPVLRFLEAAVTLEARTDAKS